MSTTKGRQCGDAGNLACMSCAAQTRLSASHHGANNTSTSPSNIAGQMKIAFAVTLVWLTASIAAFADSSISEVQQSLKDQGYYYGQITGQKDADTSAAIRRYQIRNGLEITGDLNEETLKSIRSNAGNTAQAAPGPANSVPPRVQSASPAQCAAEAERPGAARVAGFRSGYRQRILVCFL